MLSAIRAGGYMDTTIKSANEQIADHIVSFVNKSVNAEMELELWMITNGVDDSLYRQQLINIREAHAELLHTASELTGRIYE